MPPGSETALNQAVLTGRWEVILLAIIMLSVAGILVWLVKTWITQASERDTAAIKQSVAREELMNNRLNELEKYIREVLSQLVNESTKALLTTSISNAETVRAITNLTESLHTTRLCFSTGENQARLVEVVADRVANKVREKITQQNPQNP
jgi:predicted PurR-regulated permease PerM